jgi:hypothetical protein
MCNRENSIVLVMAIFALFLAAYAIEDCEDRLDSKYSDGYHVGLYDGAIAMREEVVSNPDRDPINVFNNYVAELNYYFEFIGSPGHVQSIQRSARSADSTELFIGRNIFS